jgi:hypothetical protein
MCVSLSVTHACLHADRTVQLQTALNGKHSAQRTADLYLARHSSDCYRSPGLEVANLNAICEGLSASHTWELLSSGGSGLDILFGRSSLEIGMQVLRLRRARCPHLYRQLCQVGPAPLVAVAGAAVRSAYSWLLLGW